MLLYVGTILILNLHLLYLGNRVRQAERQIFRTEERMDKNMRVLEQRLDIKDRPRINWKEAEELWNWDTYDEKSHESPYKNPKFNVELVEGGTSNQVF